jgi:glycosyltransferase involved in cell wall biosynthesis
MKVAIDSGPLRSGHAVRGIGVMVKEQIEALQKISKKDKTLKVDAVDFEKKDLTGYDVVHYPYFFPYSLTLPPKRTGKKMVVTIQDSIHLIYPKKYQPGIRGKINFLKQKRRLKNVDAIITISETSKKDIVRFLGVRPNKVHVVYLAPKKVFQKLKNEESKKVRKKYNLPSKFVLYVGDINYNKNIPTLIKASKIAKIPLVIVGKQALDIESQGVDLPSLQGPRDWIRFLLGKPHPELAHYNELLGEFKNGKEIIRTGFVSDEDLVKIYNAASVYCQPSFYEGFGLPILEAMACGVPVVISKTNALVEVAGEACLVADPKNPKDMVEKIAEALKRKSLVKKGFERVENFTWRKTAKETIGIYKRVVST